MTLGAVLRQERGNRLLKAAISGWCVRRNRIRASYDSNGQDDGPKMPNKSHPVPRS